MRDAGAAFSAKLLGAAFLACYCVQAGLALSHETPMKTANDNPQFDEDDVLSGRDWGSLHGSWGFKRSVPPYELYSAQDLFEDELSGRDDIPLNGGLKHHVPLNTAYYPLADKRGWQNLKQSGWGKRLDPEYPSDFEGNDLEKRDWDQFHGGWGKRTTLRQQKNRGGWGKREPGWSNLKGIWGKRSVPSGQMGL